MSDTKTSTTTTYSSSSSSPEEKLEGFVALAATPNATGSSIEPYINQVLKDPAIFTFGELLAVKNVQNMANDSKYAPALSLLQIFAYGTYAEYKSKEKKLGLRELKTAEAFKLKQLSVVEASSKTKALYYKPLLAELDLKNVRELEDLIIECVYAGILQGKLDQRKGCFEVQSVMGRDIGPKDLDNMLDTLGGWVKNSDEILTTLDTRMKQANATVEKKKKEAEDLNKEKTEAIDHIKQALQAGDQELLALALGGNNRRQQQDRDGMDDRGRGRGNNNSRDSGPTSFIKRMLGMGRRI
jgi:COP9 signalosome complex subunit 7